MSREKLARYLSKASMYRALNFMEQLFLAGFRAKKEKAVTRCIRCKRPLKDPESIKRGYGRVCREKIKKEFIETFTSIARQALNQ